MARLESELGTAAARAKRRFPDHRVDLVYRVCLPVYELVLKVTEMAESELSTTARFVLQLVHLGIGEAREVGRLMGVNDSDVVGAAAELLGGNLVGQGADRAMEITEEGRRVLANAGRALRPRNRHPRVVYDPVTKRIVYVATEELLTREEVRKRGAFVVPVGPRKPRLSSILLDEVVEYDKMYGARRQDGEMLEVSALKDVRLKYRDDVVLVKVDGAASERSIFAAYRATQYLEEESAAVQRLADRGVDVVPDEMKSGESMPWAGSAVVTSAESGFLETIESLDHKIGEREQEVAATEAKRSATLDGRERAELAGRIEALVAERNELKIALDTAEEGLSRETRGETRLIRTEQHRRLLLDAIGGAKGELILVSAWIGREAFDEEVQKGIVEAMRRGVKVRIAWGLGTNKRGSEGSRNRERGEGVLKQLRQRVPKDLRDRLVDRRTETHEKFIICDQSFCAWGSFNWLSYRGERDSGYRRETSYYSERGTDIALWRENARTLFGE